MKGKCSKALLLLLSVTALGHANQGSCKAKCKAVPEKAKKEQAGPQYIQYHNRMMVFTPFHQAYERIKNDAFYVGVEGYLAPIMNKKHDNALLDAEMRLGYNLFYNCRDHVTPFIGGGYIEDFTRKHHRTRHTSGVAYGTLGLLYDHEFNTIFNLGFRAKFLLGGGVTKKKFDWGSPVVGSDVSLPITFRCGRDRHWDIRIEPFNTYLHGSNHSEVYWGFRNSVGYRF